MQRWNDYEKAAEKGPLSIFWIIMGFLIIVVPITWIFSRACGVVNETTNVVQEEFGPRALLQKYEWFKDASAQLDKKLADIEIYENRLSEIKKSYGGSPREGWDRIDKEQMNQWMLEVSGVKASYNMLAAEYNSQMAKFNWRFTNVGQLPMGADMPLPREYRPYTK